MAPNTSKIVSAFNLKNKIRDHVDGMDILIKMLQSSPDQDLTDLFIDFIVAGGPLDLVTYFNRSIHLTERHLSELLCRKIRRRLGVCTSHAWENVQECIFEPFESNGVRLSVPQLSSLLVWHLRSRSVWRWCAAAEDLQRRGAILSRQDAESVARHQLFNSTYSDILPKLEQICSMPENAMRLAFTRIMFIGAMALSMLEIEEILEGLAWFKSHGLQDQDYQSVLEDFLVDEFWDWDAAVEQISRVQRTSNEEAFAHWLREMTSFPYDRYIAGSTDRLTRAGPRGWTIRWLLANGTSFSRPLVRMRILARGRAPLDNILAEAQLCTQDELVSLYKRDSFMRAANALGYTKVAGELLLACEEDRVQVQLQDGILATSRSLLAMQSGFIRAALHFKGASCQIVDMSDVTKEEMTFVLGMMIQSPDDPVIWQEWPSPERIQEIAEEYDIRILLFFFGRYEMIEIAFAKD